MRGHERVFHHDLIELIRIALLCLEHVHNAEAERGAAPRKQGRQHKGIHPVAEIALGLFVPAVRQYAAARDLRHVYAAHARLCVVFPFPELDEQKRIAPVLRKRRILRRIRSAVGVVREKRRMGGKAFLDPAARAELDLKHRAPLLKRRGERVEQDASVVHMPDERAAQAAVFRGVVADLLHRIAADEQIVDELAVFARVAGCVMVLPDDRLDDARHVPVPGALRRNDRVRNAIHQIRADVLDRGLDHGRDGPRLGCVRLGNVVPMISAVHLFAVRKPLPFREVRAAKLGKERHGTLIQRALFLRLCGYWLHDTRSFHSP
ncbi:unknown [Clostridium sp. CAG:1024]|nr:unknown [Clostridium sp. CAG:1024]